MDLTYLLTYSLSLQDMLECREKAEIWITRLYAQSMDEVELSMVFKCC